MYRDLADVRSYSMDGVGSIAASSGGSKRG